MSQDKFKPRGRSGADSGDKQQYDFSAIAGEAVSRARAQGALSDDFDDIEPSAPGIKDERYDSPRARLQAKLRGRAAEDPPDDPFAQQVSRDQAIGGSLPNLRKAFSKKRPDDRNDSYDRPAEQTEKPDGEKRKTPGFVKLLPQSVTGRDRFDRKVEREEVIDGKPAETLRKPDRPGRRKPGASPDDGQWDNPVSRDDVAGTDTGRDSRKPIAFGRRGARADAADEFSEAPQEGRASKPAAFSPRSNRVNDADEFSEVSQDGRADEPAASIPNRRRRIAADVQEGAAVPSRSVDPAPRTASDSAPVRAGEGADSFPADGTEPPRRRFNAATQPNYGYMTDHREEVQPEESPVSGLSALKASLASRLGRAEDTTEYYTPPADRAPTDIRRHQKRRNRRPWPLWLKATVFGLCLAVSFIAIVYAAFYVIITGRIDYVVDSSGDTVYLSVAEKANHEADLTDTEENAAEFTEPLSSVKNTNGVKVIMVVSSDSQIGNNGGKTAKTDAIMLMAVDHQNRRIRIASLMTDTYVRIQDYQSNKLSKAYYYDTVNSDYSLPRLKKAIEDNFGVVPDNFVVVDFDALQIIVERIGGVDVYVTADEAYYMSSHERYGDFPRFNSEGPYSMSGAEALNYVRMRAVGNGDFDRVARQRKVFSQLLVKLQRKSMLELAELAYSVLPELPTDMSAGDVFGYLMGASDISTYEITEVTFPITNSWRYGTATVREEAESMFGSDSTGGAVSASDVNGLTQSAAVSTDNKFTVIVTNFQFNATALQRYLYDNDESYLNGAMANGVTVPDIIAPLESDSPAASLNGAA